MKASKIGVLFLVLGFGATVETAWQVRKHVGPRGWQFGFGNNRFSGPSFRFTAEETRELPSGATLEVQNAFGAVRITQVPGTAVRIALSKVVFMTTEAEAARIAARLTLRADAEPTRLRVSTNRELVEADTQDVGIETHLEITVPPGTPVKIVNEHGAVDVADVAAAEVENAHGTVSAQRVAGPVNVRSRHDDVSVGTVTGAVRIELRHGDVKIHDVDGAATVDVEHGDLDAERVRGLVVSAAHGEVKAAEVKGDLQVEAQHCGVTARSVTGNANVRTSYQDVTLEQMGGDVTVAAEHGGIRVEDVTGKVRAESSYNDVVVARAGGPVEIEVQHGGVRAADIAQGAVVRSSGDSVTLEGFKGPVEIEAERAAVRLVATGPLAAAVLVRTSHGDIELDVPPGGPFSLEANAEDGEVSASVPGLMQSASGPHRLVAQLGSGGPSVRLTASRGSVHVRQAAPAPPAPVAVTAQ